MSDTLDAAETSLQAPLPRNPKSDSIERLSIPTGARLIAGVGMGFIGGAGLGLSHGGTIAGMRFRAENAHRFPTSQAGWYLYHKTKNYHVVLGGLKEGAKMGTKLGFWAGSFFGIEQYMDEQRGKKDFISSAIAGFGVGAAFSLWNMFPLMTMLRTTKTGFYGGMAYGLAQDALSFVMGRRPQYVDWVTNALEFSKHESSEKGET